MTAEHEGVSPATAGGASTPNPATVDNSIAYALTHHYGFLPLNVRYRAAQVARAIVEQSKTEAPLAEILPAEERKPVYSEPGLDTDWDEDIDAQVIHGVGWSLSWGCKLSIARDCDTGEHYVCVNTSGEDQRRGIVSRSTTREQIASFGQQLLNVFGESDSSDIEIERDRVLAALTRIAAKIGGDTTKPFTVTDAVDGWIVKGADRDAEIERLRAQVDELAGIRVALFGEVRQALTDRDRWQANYNQLIGGALAVQQHLQRAAGKLIHPSDEFDKAFSLSVVDELVAERDRLHVELERPPLEFYGRLVARIRQALREEHDLVDCTAGVLKAELGRLIDVLEVEVAQHDQTKAERDRLRQELDLIGEQVPTFRDGQRVRIGRHFGTVEKPKAVTRVRLDGMAPSALFETRLVNAIEDVPAEPRRWVAGDAEDLCDAGNEDYPELRCKRAAGHWGSHEDPTQGATWSVEVAANPKDGA